MWQNQATKKALRNINSKAEYMFLKIKHSFNLYHIVTVFDERYRTPQLKESRYMLTWEVVDGMLESLKILQQNSYWAWALLFK